MPTLIQQRKTAPAENALSDNNNNNNDDGDDDDNNTTQLPPPPTTTTTRARAITAYVEAAEIYLGAIKLTQDLVTRLESARGVASKCGVAVPAGALRAGIRSVSTASLVWSMANCLRALLPRLKRLLVSALDRVEALKLRTKEEEQHQHQHQQHEKNQPQEAQHKKQQPAQKERQQQQQQQGGYFERKVFVASHRSSDSNSSLLSSPLCKADPHGGEGDSGGWDWSFSVRAWSSTTPVRPLISS